MTGARSAPSSTWASCSTGSSRSTRTPARRFTHEGRRIPYDVLVVATGARRVEPLAGALTFGMRPSPTARLRAVVADLVAGRAASVAFALPWPSSWSLPLYELALLTAHEVSEHGCTAGVRIVTPEARALELLGPAAHHAVSRCSTRSASSSSRTRSRAP